MKNFVQRGDVVTATAPSGGVVSGAGVLLGSLFGVAAITAAQGESFELVLEGVFDLAKVTGAVSYGAPLYWSTGDSKLTTADGDGANALVGVAVAAALSGDATVRARLNGAFGAGAASVASDHETRIAALE